MNFKRFLKPDKRKIIVFMILLIMGVGITHPVIYPEFPFSFFSFPFGIIEMRGAPCPPLPPGVVDLCAVTIIIYQNILLNLISYYFFSCLLIFIWDKFRGRKVK